MDKKIYHGYTKVIFCTISGCKLWCTGQWLAEDSSRFFSASAIRTPHRLTLLTTSNPQDDPIEQFAEKHNYSCFRGSEHNVLDRFYRAACVTPCKTIVRLTADNPLIDPTIIDATLHHFIHGDFDYLSTDQTVDLPRGLDVEIFSYFALKKAVDLAATSEDFEHVTWVMKRLPHQFVQGRFLCHLNRAKERLTVDTHRDFLVVSSVIEALYPTNPLFSLHDIFAYLDTYPQLRKLNTLPEGVCVS